MGKNPAVKNWKPRKIISFLQKQGFIQVKLKGKNDHVCLFKPETKAYTEVDLGRKDYSAREMLSVIKQSGINREDWY